MKALSGIYAITHIESNKSYIGSSSDTAKRMWNHLNLLRRGCHWNVHLQNAWNKHGESAFAFSVLEYASPNSLLKREDWWIQLLQTQDRSKGYNIKTAAGGPMAPETKVKCINKLKLAWADPERRELWTKALREAHSRPEVKQRHSEAYKKSCMGPEMVAKRSVAIKAANAKPEVKEKRSLSAKRARLDPKLRAASALCVREYAKRPEVKRHKFLMGEQRRSTDTALVKPLWEQGLTRKVISDLTGLKYARVEYLTRWIEKPK